MNSFAKSFFFQLPMSKDSYVSTAKINYTTELTITPAKMSIGKSNYENVYENELWLFEKKS